MEKFTRLIDDLVIGFGFSKLNAAIAVRRFEQRKLTSEQMDVISNLWINNPFQKSEGKHCMQINVTKAASVLKPLNYSISMQV